MKNIKEQTITTFDKILVPSTLTFLSNYPELQIPIIIAYGFFGISMQYKQDEVNEFINIFKDNPEIFISEVVKTKEFSDGCILIFESYIKERNDEKRRIMKNILLGFTEMTMKEKKKFKLERLLDITNKITEEELNYLKHLNYDLKPLQTKAFSKDILESGYYHDNLNLEQPVTSFRNKLNKDFDEYYDALDIIGLRFVQSGLVSLNLIFSLDFKRDDSIEDYDFSDTIKQYEFTQIGNDFISYILENEKT